MTNLQNESVRNSKIMINTDSHKNDLNYKNGLRTSTHREDHIRNSLTNNLEDNYKNPF